MKQITVWLYVLAAGAVLAALGYVAILRSNNASLAAENAALGRSVYALQAQAAQAREAQAVASEYTEYERDLRRKAETTIDAIRNAKLGVCADEALDPDLSDILNGLFRAD